MGSLNRAAGRAPGGDEETLQLGAPPVDAALDGSRGDAEAVADLLVWHLLEEPELHHFPKLGGQPIQCRQQTGAHFARFQDAVRAQERIPGSPFQPSLIGEQPLPLADLRPVVVYAVVPGDRVQPHGEMRPRVEAVQLVVDPDDDLLGQFFGLLVLAGKAVGEREEAPAMPSDEVGPRGIGVQLTSPERPDGCNVL